MNLESLYHLGGPSYSWNDRLDIPFIPLDFFFFLSASKFTSQFLPSKKQMHLYITVVYHGILYISHENLWVDITESIHPLYGSLAFLVIREL